MNEEKNISRILSYEESQTKVDAIIEIEKNNVVKNRQIIQESLRRDFAKKRENKYPIDLEEQRNQKRKYTQSFSNAMQEEEKKIKEEKQRILIEMYREQRKREKANKAYKRQEITTSLLDKENWIQRCKQIIIKLLEEQNGDEGLAQNSQKQAQSENKGLIQNTRKQTHKEFCANYEVGKEIVHKTKETDSQQKSKTDQKGER